MKREKGVYGKLFISTLKLSAGTFGGGFVIVPLMREKFVNELHWIDEQEMLDLVATAGCVLPSCCIVMALAYVYYRFRGLDTAKGILAALRPAVVAMIASAGISLLIMAFYGQRTLPEDLGGINWLSVALFCVSLFVLRRFRAKPIYVMLGAGALGILASLII